MLATQAITPSILITAMNAKMGRKKGPAESAQGIYGPEGKDYRCFRHQSHLDTRLKYFA